MPADTRSQLLEMHGVLEALNKENLGPADRYCFWHGRCCSFLFGLAFRKWKIVYIMFTVLVEIDQAED